MKQLENTLQDLKCMLIEDGYKDDNIVLRTLIRAQQQVKNLNVSKSLKCECKHSGNCRYETVILETKELCRHKE